MRTDLEPTTVKAAGSSRACVRVTDTRMLAFTSSGRPASRNRMTPE
jgi:hypothetical protein